MDEQPELQEVEYETIEDEEFDEEEMIAIIKWIDSILGGYDG